MRRGRLNIFPGCQYRGPDAWSSGASPSHTRVQTEAHRGLLPPFAFRDFATLEFTALSPDPCPIIRSSCLSQPVLATECSVFSGLRLASIWEACKRG